MRAERNLRCEEAQSAIERLADGEVLDASLRGAVEEHLASCEVCSADELNDEVPTLYGSDVVLAQLASAVGVAGPRANEVRVSGEWSALDTRAAKGPDAAPVLPGWARVGAPGRDTWGGRRAPRPGLPGWAQPGRGGNGDAITVSAQTAGPSTLASGVHAQCLLELPEDAITLWLVLVRHKLQVLYFLRLEAPGRSAQGVALRHGDASFELHPVALSRLQSLIPQSLAELHSSRWFEAGGDIEAVVLPETGWHLVLGTTKFPLAPTNVTPSVLSAVACAEANRWVDFVKASVLLEDPPPTAALMLRQHLWRLAEDRPAVRALPGAVFSALLELSVLGGALRERLEVARGATDLRVWFDYLTVVEGARGGLLVEGTSFRVGLQFDPTARGGDHPPELGETRRTLGTSFLPEGYTLLHWIYHGGAGHRPLQVYGTSIGLAFALHHRAAIAVCEAPLPGVNHIDPRFAAAVEGVFATGILSKCDGAFRVDAIDGLAAKLDALFHRLSALPSRRALLLIPRQNTLDVGSHAKLPTELSLLARAHPYRDLGVATETEGRAISFHDIPGSLVTIVPIGSLDEAERFLYGDLYTTLCDAIRDRTPGGVRPTPPTPAAPAGAPQPVTPTAQASDAPPAPRAVSLRWVALIVGALAALGAAAALALRGDGPTPRPVVDAAPALPPPAEAADTCAVLTADEARDWCPRGVPVRVAARARSCPTGVRVAAGQRFRAAPRPGDAWSLQAGPPADGPTGRAADSPFPVREGEFVSRVAGHPFGALIGATTGCPNAWFGLGDDAAHTSTCGGELVLAANENADDGCDRYGTLGCAYDNHSAIHVCVTAEPPSSTDPSTLVAQPGATFTVTRVTSLGRDGPCTRLSVEGTHTLAPGAVVRAFLEDRFGALYPQDPPATLTGNRWTMPGLRRCGGIVAVRLVRLTVAGEQVVRGRVDAGQFGSMALPAGSVLLARHPLGAAGRAP
ncbi:MAG: zf-HC2 domain-containing protein [Deltaproteobacteria bacterium]|nr:zf-HC2 domain-containing protein [Deltaproteobacteria bacterium]